MRDTRKSPHPSTFGDRVLGKLFGFPQCCIDFYCESPSLVRRQAKGFLGYRFCPNCSERSEEDVIKSISANRICPAPFPHQPSMEHLRDILKDSRWTELERAWLMENTSRYMRADHELLDLAAAFHNEMSALDRQLREDIKREPERKMYFMALHEKRRHELSTSLLNGVHDAFSHRMNMTFGKPKPEPE